MDENTNKKNEQEQAERERVIARAKGLEALREMADLYMPTHDANEEDEE